MFPLKHIYLNIVIKQAQGTMTNRLTSFSLKCVWADAKFAKTRYKHIGGALLINIVVRLRDNVLGFRT